MIDLASGNPDRSHEVVMFERIVIEQFDLQSFSFGLEQIAQIEKRFDVPSRRQRLSLV